MAQPKQIEARVALRCSVLFGSYTAMASSWICMHLCMFLSIEPSTSIVSGAWHSWHASQPIHQSCFEKIISIYPFVLTFHTAISIHPSLAIPAKKDGFIIINA
jgi:hypothetical protein